MPIFEFKCSACAAVFDKMITHAEKEQVVCPDCASAAVKPLLSAFSSTKGGADSAPLSPCHQCGAHCAHAHG
jgi:putative FmdB family regulatory protein